jgi:hypothetical protein
MEIRPPCSKVGRNWCSGRDDIHNEVIDRWDDWIDILAALTGWQPWLARCWKATAGKSSDLNPPPRSVVENMERLLGDGILWEHTPRATNAEAHAAVVTCRVTITLSFRCLSRMWVEFIVGRWIDGFHSNSVRKACGGMVRKCSKLRCHTYSRTRVMFLIRSPKSWSRSRVCDMSTNVRVEKRKGGEEHPPSLWAWSGSAFSRLRNYVPIGSWWLTLCLNMPD